MSTTSVGDEFEAEVFEFLQGELSAGRLGLLPACCRMFRKKSYYSQISKADIEFDISIEVWRPGASSYSALWLFECKRHGRPLEAKIARDLFVKMQEVAGNKAVIISTSPFQKGAEEFCKSNNIGFVRYFDVSGFQWILNRSPSAYAFFHAAHGHWRDIQHALTSAAYRSRRSPFYCCNGSEYTTSLPAFLQGIARETIIDGAFLARILRDVARPRPVVPYLSRDDIEQRSRAILEAIGHSEGKVPLERICEWQSEETGLRLHMNVPPTERERADEILGRIRFDPLEITIYEPSAGIPGRWARQKFTLAHELGHHFLDHSRYIAGEYCEISDLEHDGTAEAGLDDIRRMEWQANHFASCLLLPKKALSADFFEVLRRHDIRDRGFGHLYVDGQRCNLMNYLAVTDELMLRYGVSREVLKLRLNELGLLKDGRDQKATGRMTPIGAVIRRFSGAPASRAM